MKLPIASARVEVVNETTPATQAEADSLPPAAALERCRTAVEIDILGQRQPERAAPAVPGEHSATPPKSVPVNMGGIQVNGNENSIEFHYHRCRRSHLPVMYPVIRHEMVIVPSDGSAPAVFMDNAPPRVAVVDKEVARAYAAHMLRLAREGRR